MDEDSYLNNGNFRDARLWSGLDPNDIRNYVDTNAIYPLPTSHAKGLVGTLANHWIVDSTILWGTGTPLQLPSANLTGATGCNSYAPAGGQTRAHWFNNNVNCYVNLKQWQARTTPLRIGYLRNPSTFFWNSVIQKYFALSGNERLLQFRIEALNAANHLAFGGPNLNNNLPPSFSPSTSWVGFGTLPTNAIGNPRNLIASIKILF